MSTFERDAADAAIRQIARERLELLDRTLRELVPSLDYDQRIELTKWMNEGRRLLEGDAAPTPRPLRIVAGPFLRARKAWGRHNDPEAA